MSDTKQGIPIILDRIIETFLKKNRGSFISALTENMKKIEQDYLHSILIFQNLSLMIFSLAMFIGIGFDLLVIISVIR